MGTPLRILICDDHAVVRRGLRSLIDINQDMELAGEATDGEEAVRLAEQLKPDVIILDLIMPRKDGIEAIHEIMDSDPAARILILTSFSEDDKVFPAIKSGARGYLLKDSSPEELLQAIRDVYVGESSLHPSIARKVIQEMNRPSSLPPTEAPLTEREVEVLKLLARGLSNQQIAQELEIREGTVRIHVGNILNKLQLANRTQAALYALREGLAKLDSE